MATVQCALPRSRGRLSAALRARCDSGHHALRGRADRADAGRPARLSSRRLVGSVSGALGLRAYMEAHGHTLIVTSDKDGPDSEFERRLPEADVVISQPFWPAYLTAERIARAPKLKLALTAGIGSDHVDLDAAARAHITVAEVTGSNSISVAEHVVMTTLALVRNYLPSCDRAARRLEHRRLRVAQLRRRRDAFRHGRRGRISCRAAPAAAVRCSCTTRNATGSMHRSSRHSLTYHADAASLASAVDIVNLQIPLYPSTEHLFDAAMIARMKRGAYLINTARAKLVDRDAVVNAVTSGHLAGYGGDVWFPQPAPADHPWRTMPFNGMTPHISGTSLSRRRYAAGTLEILQCWFDGKPIRNEYLIVDGGTLAGTGAQSYRLT